jgi:hypothetical protein
MMPLCLVAQNQKMRAAIFDPDVKGNIDEGTLVMVREMISEAMVNSGKFSIVERSLIDKVLKEQKFSNSGAVDASQASELGRLAGANKVVLSVLMSTADRHMVTIKMIDVQSASVESQKNKMVKKQSEILDAITVLTYEVLGESAPTSSQQDKDDSFLGVFSGRGEKQRSKENVPQGKPTGEQSPKEVFRARTEKDDWDFESRRTDVKAGGEVTLEFSGFKYSKNPTVELYVDGVHVGGGSLNGGFSVSFPDSRPGKQTVKLEWSGTVPTKTYEIDTKRQRRFVFEYARTGFGYVMQLKN